MTDWNISQFRKCGLEWSERDGVPAQSLGGDSRVGGCPGFAGRRELPDPQAYLHRASAPWYQIAAKDGGWVQRWWQIGIQGKQESAGESTIDYVMGAGYFDDPDRPIRQMVTSGPTGVGSK